MMELNDAVVQIVSREYCNQSFLSYLPKASAESMRRMLALRDVERILCCISSWSLIRYLHQAGYAPVLFSKRKQLEYKDDYGDIQSERWKLELRSFISNRRQALIDAYLSIPQVCAEAIIRRSIEHLLHPSETDLFLTIEEYTLDVVWQERLSNVAEAILGERSRPQPTNGYEFETYIGGLFEDHGWVVEYTPRSGDQGADLITRRNGITCAVQCKFVSDSVGNKAVQEVYSAKAFYGASMAVVVSRAGYTLAARQLAQSLDVRLLDEHQISTI